MTPEHGNVEIDNDDKQTKAMQMGAGTVERVGFFKITRTTVNKYFRRKQLRVIVRHFWKAEEETASETEHPEAWCPACTSKMEPIWFAQLAYIPFWAIVADLEPDSRTPGASVREESMRRSSQLTFL